MPTMLEDRPRTDPPAQEVVVRVVDDRGNDGGGPRRAERRRPRFSIRGAVIAALLGAIAVGVFLVLGALSGLLSFDPFSTKSVDRSAPVLLKKMADLDQYRAARGTFEVNVDIEEDVNLLPSFIAGERTIFNAVGTVDGMVDFSRLGKDAVVVGTDGAVTVTLPSPTYSKPVVDPVRSHVADRDRGLVNRLAGVFSDSPTSERDLYVFASKKLDAAARESRLLDRAEANTTTMLKGLLGKAGVANVRVVFEPPVANAANATKSGVAQR
jgi:hypothetical protein